MSSTEILAKCGLTADDVHRLATPKPTLAAENEARYASVPEVEREYIERNYSGKIYRDIAASSDNGGCTTRRGTYRRIKSGDGRCATVAEKIARRERDERLRRANGQFGRC